MANMFEEPFHFGGVGEHLAIEMARVPFDENHAEVEDDVHAGAASGAGNNGSYIMMA